MSRLSTRWFETAIATIFTIALLCGVVHERTGSQVARMAAVVMCLLGVVWAIGRFIRDRFSGNVRE